MIGTARQMRKAPTAAERVLWEAFRRKGVAGMRFRRQRVIGPYIVDFCCLEHRVVVEVDGAHHLDSEVVSYDGVRTEYLEAMGYRVLRFSNEQVMSDLESIVREIGAHSFPPRTGERLG